YGSGSKLRVVTWTVAMIVSQSIQDVRIKDRWSREGPPADALLVDVVLHKSRVLEKSTIGLVIEHDSFDPVPAGVAIPEQSVVFIDVAGAMHYLKQALDSD